MTGVIFPVNLFVRSTDELTQGASVAACLAVNTHDARTCIVDSDGLARRRKSCTCNQK